MSRATLSTHVLDTALGTPAAGVHVTLLGATGELLGRGVTGPDGRIPDLVAGGVDPGRHRLVFELAGYFTARAHLFETVTLDLTIVEARHHHVPLLIGPYACSAYRGS